MRPRLYQFWSVGLKHVYSCWLALVIVLAGCTEQSISPSSLPEAVTPLKNQTREVASSESLQPNIEKQDDKIVPGDSSQLDNISANSRVVFPAETFGDLAVLPKVPELEQERGEGSVAPGTEAKTNQHKAVEGMGASAAENKTSQKTSVANVSLRPLEDEKGGPVRVAILLPLTGSSADIGKAMLNAAIMAVLDLADDRFQLIPRDTEGLPEGARAAAEEALASGAEVILGPLFSNSVQAAAEATRPAGVNMLAFSNDRSVAGDGVYLLGFMPGQQVRRVVGYASSQGVSRFAALLPETTYGSEVLQVVQELVPLTGGSITKVETYTSEIEDFREVVQRLSDYKRRKSALVESKKELSLRTDVVAKRTLERLKNQETIGDVGFDAVLLPEGGSRLRSIAPLLTFYDVDPALVRILGTGMWDEPDIGLEPALVGGWFAGPSPDSGAAFRARYASIFGKPPQRLASLAYDATALAAALARGRSRPDYSSAALTHPAGFTGIDGLFRLHPEGITERGLAVLEVLRDGFRIISPAPKTFD